MRGLGRAAFVAILLLIAGTLNVIYGIAAVGNARAGGSLMGGGAFGRVIGIIAASLGALESLLSIGGTHPWWSLAIFAMCLWILHGLVVYGDEEAGEPSHT